ncbi:MAG: biopolymer transporter ExbD [Bacteriovoracaceae bacterium]|nr:biopolymer transporter ExbD [Bacteriovoracaceae bacterium]
MALKLDEQNIEKSIEHVNLTPLIDIMLVLLIIFMVTSSISLESGLDIDIPKTTSATSTKDNTAIIVSLNRDGEVSVQGGRVKFENLMETIRNAISETKSNLVIFEGDRHSHLGKAIEIMDIAKSAGAKRFAIAAENVK